jgi:Winged helix-turn helix
LSRELRTMGYRKLSARPRHHAQAEGAIEHFKKLSRAVARLRTVETASGILAGWRVAAVSLLEAQSPLKNVVHGCMRT